MSGLEIQMVQSCFGTSVQDILVYYMLSDGSSQEALGVNRITSHYSKMSGHLKKPTQNYIRF